VIFMALVIVLPVLGLPLFWILPLRQALPLYVLFLGAFTGTMWIMHRTMHYPKATGPEPLIGEEGEVVSETGGGYGPPYMVRVRGELWSAESRDALRVGDAVVVISVVGNCVRVKRGDAGRAGP